MRLSAWARDGTIYRLTWYYYGSFNVHSGTDAFDIMVQMGHPKEQWRQKDGRFRTERLQQQRHHAGTKCELFRKRRHDMVTQPQNILNAFDPIRRCRVCAQRTVQCQQTYRTQEQRRCQQQWYEYRLSDARDAKTHNFPYGHIGRLVIAQQIVNKERWNQHHDRNAEKSPLHRRRMIAAKYISSFYHWFSVILTFVWKPIKGTFSRKTVAFWHCSILTFIHTVRCACVHTAPTREINCCETQYPFATRIFVNFDETFMNQCITDCVRIAICTNCRQKITIKLNKILLNGILKVSVRIYLTPCLTINELAELSTLSFSMECVTVLRTERFQMMSELFSFWSVSTFAQSRLGHIYSHRIFLRRDFKSNSTCIDRNLVGDFSFSMWLSVG